jgi:hypothetical protein
MMGFLTLIPLFIALLLVASPYVYLIIYQIEVSKMEGATFRARQWWVPVFVLLILGTCLVIGMEVSENTLPLPSLRKSLLFLPILAICLAALALAVGLFLRRVTVSRRWQNGIFIFFYLPISIASCVFLADRWLVPSFRHLQPIPIYPGATLGGACMVGYKSGLQREVFETTDSLETVTRWYKTNAPTGRLQFWEKDWGFEILVDGEPYNELVIKQPAANLKTEIYVPRDYDDMIKGDSADFDYPCEYYQQAATRD